MPPPESSLSSRTCGFSGPGDLSGIDTFLGSLQDNGGPIFTHALLPGSSAIETGDSAKCPATDRRGVGRSQVSGCDIGAYELP